MVQELVGPGLLHVEDLSPQRKDGLERTVPALLGAPACGLPLHDVELALRGVLLRAVRELSGQAGALQGGFPPGRVPRLPGGLASLVSRDGLPDDRLGHGGVLQQVLGQLVVHEPRHGALRDAAPQLRLGLTLELGLGHPDAHDGRQALADIAALQGGVLQQVVGLPVVVDRLGEGRPEPCEMGPSLGGEDRVDERIDLLVVAVGPLHGDVDHHAVPLAGEMDGCLVDRRLGPVQILHELRHATVVVEPLLPACALVLEVDCGLLVQERLVAEPVLKRRVVELDGLEHLLVGPERDLRPVAVGVADDLDGAVGHPDPVRLPPDLVLPVHRGYEPLGQRVDDGDSHPVQSSGDLVAVLVELPSGMEVCQAHLQGRFALLVVDACGDTPSIVHDRDGPVLVDRYVHLGGEPGHDLVDTVVHDLVDHVVETAGVRGPDVHTGPLPHSLETFEGHDAVRIVLLLGVFHVPIHDNRMTYLLMLYIHAYTRAHAPVRAYRRSASEYAGSARDV